MHIIILSVYHIILFKQTKDKFKLFNIQFVQYGISLNELLNEID